MIDEIDFIAEHRKADMSKVNRIRVNGKTYLSADKILEIIESVSDDWLEDNCEWDWHGEMKSRVLALRGEQG